MTITSAQPYSWIPPEFAWSERSDIFALEISITDHDLIEFIAEGTLDIHVFTQVAVNKLNAYVLLNDGLRSKLTVALGSSPHVLAKIRGSINSIPTQVFWHGAYILPGQNNVLVLAGVNKPVEESCRCYQLLKTESLRLFEKYKEELAVFNRETEEKRNEKEALHAKYPDLAKCDFGVEESRRWNQRPVVSAETIVHAFIKAVFLPLGRTTSHNRIIREFLKHASNSGWLPPREGSYEGLNTYDENRRKVFVASWQPYEGLAAYPEVRWAVQKRLPRTLQNPRLTGTSRPIISAAEQQPVSIEWKGDTEWQDALDNLQLNDTDYREQISSVRETLSQQGFEAIAWYQAFHVWTEDFWGIYFDATKLDDLAHTIFDECRQQRYNCSFSLCAQLAFGLIYNHELFHARVEAALSWLELNTSRPKYLRYTNNVYKHLAGTDDWLEEALANFESWQFYESFLQQTGTLHLQDKEKLDQVVEAILDMSPAGYNKWRTGRHKLSWKRLATQMVQGRAEMPEKSVLPLESLLSEALPYDFRQSDIPLIFVGSGAIADRLQSLPSVINIPARKEIERALRYFQYALDSSGGKGSHEKWVGPDNRAFILPRRDPLSRGVFKTFLDHFNINKITYAREIRPNL